MYKTFILLISAAKAIIFFKWMVRWILLNAMSFESLNMFPTFYGSTLVSEREIVIHFYLQKVLRDVQGHVN